MRKLGRFLIPDTIMHDESKRKQLGVLFDGVIVVKCDYSMLKQGYEYVAFYDGFEPVKDQEDAPWYHVVGYEGGSSANYYDFVKAPDDGLQAENARLRKQLDEIRKVMGAA